MKSMTLAAFLAAAGIALGVNAPAHAAPKKAAVKSPARKKARKMKSLALHSDNPHYFLFRSKPTVLITSGEHYGAVLNLDFDYKTYLAELHAKDLNLTRTFTGVYMENPGAFNIAENNLAPKAERLICPYARSSTPGYANGGNKFDLTRWDEAYFRRLKEFMSEADKNGVVVEFTLFCPYYEEDMWALSPLNVKNNVNGIGEMDRKDVLTLKHPEMVAVHEKLARKIVEELNGFENVYFEICNEPYFGGVTLDWQKRIAETIVDEESKLPNKHLISQNINNGSEKIEHPFPEVSVFSFHYAHPPVTVGMNYGLNRVIAENETGFRGTEDILYRSEAWEFILAGGGVYNNLDYSFTPAHPDGSFQYPDSQPGGGGPALRKELQILHAFMQRVDFVHMKPDTSFVKGGIPEDGAVQALIQPGKQWAIYVRGKIKDPLTLELPAGHYEAEWWDTLTGHIEIQEVRSTGGPVPLTAPTYKDDVALILRAR